MDQLTIYTRKQNVVNLKNWPWKGLCGRCLSEIIDWRYSQSCWYFRPSFVNCGLCLWPPLTFSLGSNLPPPPCPFHVWISILFARIQYVRGGGLYGVLDLSQINTCRKVHLLVNFLRWRHFALHFLWVLSFYVWYRTVQHHVRCAGKLPSDYF